MRQQLEPGRQGGYKRFCVPKKLTQALEPRLNFEKKKALILFYCLVQFRNQKANNFNVLYLATAGIMRELWTKNPVFRETITQVMTILKLNCALRIPSSLFHPRRAGQEGELLRYRPEDEHRG
jgi:hypothetical protein